MKQVLVDTSIWVEHFRHGNSTLVELLNLNRVMAHPLVIGEIACGTPAQRDQTLSSLLLLPQSQQAALPEVLDFIQREHLYGLGCGLVDLLLLSSTLLTAGALLWTADKRLAKLALRFYPSPFRQILQVVGQRTILDCT